LKKNANIQVAVAVNGEEAVAVLFGWGW